jgi:hypothetical protein
VRTAMGYIGLVPRDTQPGDVLFLLQGLNTPFVLRKVKDENHFLLVGPCYLHGFMDGQEWDDMKCHDLWIV